jgi:tetratricopeptide (TPR) repeat protein
MTLLKPSRLSRTHGLSAATLLAVVFLSGVTFASPDLSPGISAFEERRWPDAMDAFLMVLKDDPANPQAHAFVVLVTREMEAQRQSLNRQARLQILGNASRSLGDGKGDPTPIEQAIMATTLSDKKSQEDKWRSRCEEADMERQAGHLLVANDLIFQVLAENDAFPEAQRELSNLQSDIRRSLDTGAGVSILEHFALEGFYAYGQADYGQAAKSWAKLETLLNQSYMGTEAVRRAKALHFSAYYTVALQHVNEQKRLAELQSIFEDGIRLFQEKHFARALDYFRKLAVLEPDYPQLGFYLVQSEAGSDRERSERLGEEKRQQIDRDFQSGLAALEKEQLSEAEIKFEEVLNLDPTHSQAHAYLTMVRAEIRKRHDPQAAQMHYESGLIAYASGKLDEAMQEWNMAVRMNPEHEKALKALSKVQRELALNRQESPNETLP